jgi:broad specificity phosphatase PhoE
MPTTFVLIRHAQGTHNVDFYKIGHEQWTHPIYIDAQLTETGILQAAAVQEELAKYKFDAIYCSPLRRTRATLLGAYPASRDLPVIVDDRVIEQPQGMNSCDQRLERDLVCADCPPAWNTDGVAVVNPFFDPVDRSYEYQKTLTDEITKKYPDGTVLIVTHGTWMYNWLLAFKSLSRPMLNNCEIVVAYI